MKARSILNSQSIIESESTIEARSTLQPRLVTHAPVVYAIEEEKELIALITCRS